MFDAGVLPYELNNEVVDIGGLANARVTHGGLRFQDLDRAKVQLVILGYSGTALTPAPFGGPGAPVAFQYAINHKFWSSNAAEFAPSYYLSYLVTPAVAERGLPQKLTRVFEKSQQTNSKTDDQTLLDNLWHFPFLSS